MVIGPGSRPGRRPFKRSTARGLPAAAAPVAGNNPAPLASAVVAGELATAGGDRCPDRYPDGNVAAGTDPTGDLAATGRRNAGACHGKGNAVGRTAIAPPGDEDHIPDAVIGSCPHPSGLRVSGGRDDGRTKNGGRKDPSQGAHEPETGEIGHWLR